MKKNCCRCCYCRKKGGHYSGAYKKMSKKKSGFGKFGDGGGFYGHGYGFSPYYLVPFGYYDDIEDWFY